MDKANNIVLVLTEDEFRFLSIMGIQFMHDQGALDGMIPREQLAGVIKRQMAVVPQEAKSSLAGKMKEANLELAQRSMRNVFNG